jgi:hypothetical protein
MYEKIISKSDLLGKLKQKLDIKICNYSIVKMKNLKVNFFGVVVYLPLVQKKDIILENVVNMIIKDVKNYKARIIFDIMIKRFISDKQFQINILYCLSC